MPVKQLLTINSPNNNFMDHVYYVQYRLCCLFPASIFVMTTCRARLEMLHPRRQHQSNLEHAYIAL
jgi:hypothetical protein